MDKSNSVAKKLFKSPLRYPGGKQRAILQISKLLPQNAEEYREPLVGGGSVYFHARSISFAKTYWINDKFKELVSFWKSVQDPSVCQQLQNELEQMRTRFNSSDEIKKYFIDARKEDPHSEYREALLFFFFNRVTFSGTTKAGGFSKLASQRRFTASSIERLSPMPNALRGTQITNLGFEKVIREPGKNVFIFIDPPYFTASRLYGRGGILHEFDHELLADCLKRSDHKFLITYDDCAQIRKLYDWAKIKKWSLQYGMNNCNTEHTSKIGSEIFISNY
ncbi:MAG: DNA adenine methylase [Cyanobacteria bacterium TGS_CYA1]|nr:DNA adenine methylase [Cyanobacteria bacterium TGS_CYA1]